MAIDNKKVLECKCGGLKYPAKVPFQGFVFEGHRCNKCGVGNFPIEDLKEALRKKETAEKNEVPVLAH